MGLRFREIEREMNDLADDIDAELGPGSCDSIFAKTKNSKSNRPSKKRKAKSRKRTA